MDSCVPGEAPGRPFTENKMMQICFSLSARLKN